MTLELWILVICTILGLFFPFFYNWHYGKQVGGKALAGNRENLPERRGAAARGLRAHQNHLENLLPFAIVILVARIAGMSNFVTELGAVLFLIGRLVHSITYCAGISVAGIRSIAYFVGLFGILCVASQLLHFLA